MSKELEFGMTDIEVEEIKTKIMLHVCTGDVDSEPVGILLDLVEALIDQKIAIAMEMVADRVQDATGVRP